MSADLSGFTFMLDVEDDYLAATTSLPVLASSCHFSMPSRFHHSSVWTLVVQISFQSTLLLVP
jgi:hypothetical protein